MRLLATIPEIAVTAGCQATRPDEPAASPARLTAAPAIIPPRATRRRGGRVVSKPGFPFVSAAALAVITAVVWSLVAAREAARPGHHRPAARLAAESPPRMGTMR